MKVPGGEILTYAKLNFVMRTVGYLVQERKDREGSYPMLLEQTTLDVECDCGNGMIVVAGKRNPELESKLDDAAALYVFSYRCNAKGCLISDQGQRWTIPRG